MVGCWVSSENKLLMLVSEFFIFWYIKFKKLSGIKICMVKVLMSIKLLIVILLFIMLNVVLVIIVVMVVVIILVWFVLRVKRDNWFLCFVIFYWVKLLLYWFVLKVLLLKYFIVLKLSRLLIVWELVVELVLFICWINWVC